MADPIRCLREGAYTFSSDARQRRARLCRCNGVDRRKDAPWAHLTTRRRYFVAWFEIVRTRFLKANAVNEFS
jgi:hypothetical protein